MGDRYRVNRSTDGGYTIRESDLSTDIAVGIVGVAGNIIGASISGLASMARNSRDLRVNEAIDVMDRAVNAGDYELLLNLATEFSRNYQNDPVGPAYLAIAFASMRRFEQATTSIHQAEKLGLPHILVISLRASTFREKGDIGQAIREFTALTKYSDTEQDGYLGRAQLLIELGDLDQALADVNHAVSIAPGEYAYYVRGCVYQAQGNQQKADEDFARSDRLSIATQAAIEQKAQEAERARIVAQAMLEVQAKLEKDKLFGAQTWLFVASPVDANSGQQLLRDQQTFKAASDTVYIDGVAKMRPRQPQDNSRLQEFCDSLMQQGWQLTEDRGSHWFSYRFRRLNR